MKLWISDVRALGYRKIVKYYLGNAEFIDALSQLNKLFSNYKEKVKSYSFIRDKEYFNDVDRNECSLLEFIDRISPFALNLDDKVEVQRCQRSFRNTWNLLWKNVSVAIGEMGIQTPPDVYNNLQLLALKHPYLLEDWKDENFRVTYTVMLLSENEVENIMNKVFEFYNVLFNWAYITLGNDLDTDKLLTFIVTTDMCNFGDELTKVKENIEEYWSGE